MDNVQLSLIGNFIGLIFVGLTLFFFIRYMIKENRILKKLNSGDFKNILED